MKTREPCSSVELKGETVYAILGPRECPAIADLHTYHAYALWMRSGKVFAVTTCSGEVCFNRVLPDLLPVEEFQRDPRTEAQWVVFGGILGASKCFMKEAGSFDLVTLDDAAGWPTRRAAAEAASPYCERTLLTKSSIGRRSSFRK